jgi:branched-chain amino acid transport system ATP-binding protein
MNLFEAKHIHKRFGQQVVLENVNLSFEENKLSGIVGPNGAGKTTLFNILTGKYKPDRGQVIFDGIKITGLPIHKIARLGIARSFQIMNLFDEYTVLENITVALPGLRMRQFDTMHNVPTDSVLEQEAFSILERIGLAKDAYAESKSLSYGKRRALEIGVALASNPRMLFLDEPTQGLGAEQRHHLTDLIHTVKEDTTIVVIEHDMQFLMEIADVISVVLWGQVIATDSPDKLKMNWKVL